MSRRTDPSDRLFNYHYKSYNLYNQLPHDEFFIIEFLR